MKKTKAKIWKRNPNIEKKDKIINNILKMIKNKDYKIDINNMEPNIAQENITE